MRYYFSVVFLFLFSSVFSHSGGTDSKGGHNDRVNGGYHYHHGERAHSHQNGCKYKNESIKKTESKSNAINDGVFGVPSMVYWMSIFIISFLAAINMSIEDNKVKGQQYFEKYFFWPSFMIVYLLPSYYCIVREDYLVAFGFLILSLMIVGLPYVIMTAALSYILIKPSIKIINKFKKKSFESNTAESSNSKISQWLKSTKAQNIFVTLFLISIFGGCLYLGSKYSKSEKTLEEKIYKNNPILKELDEISRENEKRMEQSEESRIRVEAIINNLIIPNSSSTENNSSNVYTTNDLSPNGQYDKIVNHSYYTLSYAEAHEQAEWVMYTLQGSALNPSIGRTDNFRPDPRVSTGTAQLSDYRGSGFDRGHLAPAADMKYSSTSMSESFFMSNMSPQTPSFNRQIWRKIESQFRSWGHEYEKIIVVTGPVLNGDYLGAIGSNGVTVPRYYYKVAIDPNNLERNIAVLIENKGSSASVQSFVVSIDYLESVTGIDFFYKLDDALETLIESTTHKNLWNWNTTSSNRTYTTTVTPNTTEPSNNTQGVTGDYFKTTSGTKYHKDGCRYLSRSKIPITLSEAQESGLGPCSVCKP